MSTKNEIATTDALRLRVARVKSRIKTADYTPIYQYEFGEQSKDELDRIRAVWNLRATDEQITTRLEVIADKMEKE